MTDRELLERAAKAAGVTRMPELQDPNVSGLRIFGGYWNPLTDDGEALRLAVRLSMMIARRINMNGEFVIAEVPGRMFEAEPVDKGWEAATRRAIVRAAAEIGKAMP